MANERTQAEIYREWRAARQQLTEAPKGSLERTMLLDEMERLRLEYLALAEKSRQRGRSGEATTKRQKGVPD